VPSRQAKPHRDLRQGFRPEQFNALTSPNFANLFRDFVLATVAGPPCQTSQRYCSLADSIRGPDLVANFIADVLAIATKMIIQA